MHFVLYHRCSSFGYCNDRLRTRHLFESLTDLNLTKNDLLCETGRFFVFMFTSSY